MSSLAPAEQEAFARRFAAYRREVWRSGHPWTWWALAAWASAFVVFVAPEALGLTKVALFAAVGLLALGVLFDRAAERKKRAYQHAHPFEV